MITVTAWIKGEQWHSLITHREAQDDLTDALRDGDIVTVDNTGTLVVTRDGRQYHYANVFALDEPADPPTVYVPGEGWAVI